METSVCGGGTKARVLVDKVLTGQGGKNAQRETGEGKNLTPNNNRGTSPSPISDQQNGVPDLVSFFLINENKWDSVLVVTVAAVYVPAPRSTDWILNN